MKIVSEACTVSLNIQEKINFRRFFVKFRKFVCNQFITRAKANQAQNRDSQKISYLLILKTHCGVTFSLSQSFEWTGSHNAFDVAAKNTSSSAILDSLLCRGCALKLNDVIIQFLHGGRVELRGGWTFSKQRGPGGAGRGVWTRGSMIAREKKFGRVRLSTNGLKMNMENVPSIVVIENLSWSSSVNRLLLLFILALVNLDLLCRESQASWMESKRLVEQSLTAVSTFYDVHIWWRICWKVFIARPRYYDF